MGLLQQPASAFPGCAVTWYPFSAHPEADSCWAVSTGPDGRVYAAACCEGLPGGTAKVMRYNRGTDSLDCLFDIAEVTGDPPESGRATQCKIHYGFAPSPGDGILYMASHLSGPPIDRPSYSPWYSWHDRQRCFRGSALVAFDTGADRILWWDTLLPKEGCRCLALDDERGILYAVSYPRDHLFAYDLATRRRRDLGRIGSINPQVLFLDRQHRVWTSSDFGHLVCYDPEGDRLEITPHRIPHDPRYQTGWHSVLYDAVPSPDGEWIYAVTWIAGPRLFRFRPGAADEGRIEDLGQATGERDLTWPMDTFTDHCGGLVFGTDGALYYVASTWEDPFARWDVSSSSSSDPARTLRGIIWRLDPATCQRRPVGELHRPEGISNYACRGAMDAQGDLFFGMVNHAQKPNGLFRVELPGPGGSGTRMPPRMWG